MNPEKAELYTAKRTTLIDLETNLIPAAWTRFRDDADPSNWILVTIDGNTKVVHLAGSGGGDGLSGILRTVTDDDIFFGGVRVSVDNRMKFYHLFIVGSNVSAMQKGKKIMFKNNLIGAFDGAHGEINISTGTEDLENEIRRQISLLSKSSTWSVP